MGAHVPDVVLLGPQSLLRWLIHVGGRVCDDLVAYHVLRGVDCRASVVIGEVYHGSINHVLSIANVLVVGSTHHLVILHHDILFYDLCLVSIVACLSVGSSRVGSICSIISILAGCLALLLGVDLV